MDQVYPADRHSDSKHWAQKKLHAREIVLLFLYNRRDQLHWVVQITAAMLLLRNLQRIVRFVVCLDSQERDYTKQSRGDGSKHGTTLRSAFN